MIPFVKMHGAGNDFIMFLAVDLGDNVLDRRTIAALCHRRLGIGGDGLIVLEPGDDQAAFVMRYYNSDGGEAQMCGNGARCAFALAHARGLVGDEGRFRSAAGLHHGRMRGPEVVEVELTGWSDLDLDFELPEVPWAHLGFCDTGVPHVVVPVADPAALEALDIDRWGPVLRSHERFGPAGANVNWVAPDPDGSCFHLRTFERGVEAETLACGTGASATAVILSLRGRASGSVRIRTRGGDELVITVDAATGRLDLTGPAVVSFHGEVMIDD